MVAVKSEAEAEELASVKWPTTPVKAWPTTLLNEPLEGMSVLLAMVAVLLPAVVPPPLPRMLKLTGLEPAWRYVWLPVTSKRLRPAFQAMEPALVEPSPQSMVAPKSVAEAAA